MPEKLSDVAGAARALQHRPKTPLPTKDRSWERKKRHGEKTMQVAFRDFPRALNERLKEIAGREGKTVAQVAVPLILYGLGQLDEGSVTLSEMEHLVQDLGSG